MRPNPGFVSPRVGFKFDYAVLFSSNSIQDITRQDNQWIGFQGKIYIETIDFPIETMDFPIQIMGRFR